MLFKFGSGIFAMFGYPIVPLRKAVASIRTVLDGRGLCLFQYTYVSMHVCQEVAPMEKMTSDCLSGESYFPSPTSRSPSLTVYACVLITTNEWIL